VKDRSIITIPSISSVLVAPKIIISSADETARLNNGVYLLPESFNRTVPKSLVRIWANGNKIYIFDRYSSKLDYSLDEIFSAYTVFNDTQKLYIKSRTSNIFYISKNSTDGIVEFYERFAEGNFPRTTFNNTFYTKTDENILNVGLNLANKKLNLYNISVGETARLLSFNNDQNENIRILNNNLLLKIKSIFNESNQVKIDIWKYFFSSIFLPKLDTQIGDFAPNSDTAVEKSRNLKNIITTLFDTDLIKLNEFNIVSSRILQGKKITSSNTKIKLADITQFSLRNEQNKKYYSLIKNTEQADKSRRFIINKENYASFIGKTIVLCHADGRILPIKINNDFKDFTYYGDGIDENKGFSFTLQRYYDGITRNIDLKSSLITSTSDVLKIIPNNSQDIYDLLILDNNEYPNFPIIGEQNRVLEITLDKQLTTNSQGDYYVMEIE